MTLTASPSTASAVERAAFGDLEVSESWFASVDHRVVGRVMSGAAMLIGAAAMALWALVASKFDAAVRGKLEVVDFLGAGSDGGFAWERIERAVQSGLSPFVVIPLFLGVATVAVPRQIGATRMAFPRLQAFVLWGYLTATALYVASYAVGDGPPQINLFGKFPDITGAGNRATSLQLGSLMLVTIVTLLGAANIVATVATQRRIGLRLGRIGSFSFASLVTSGILLISSSVFLAGLGLLLIDREFGGNITLGEFGRIWSHALWFPGRPEALLLLLPGLGALVDIAAAKVNSKPVGGVAANALLGAYGIFSLTAWASDSWVQGHVIQPTSTLQSALVVAPLGLLLLLVLGTVGPNAKNLKPDASLLFAIGMVLLVLLAVVNVALVAIRDVAPDGGLELWQFSQLSLLSVGAAVLGFLAAATEFIPRSLGRKAPAAPASLAGLASLGGFAIGALGIAGIAFQKNLDKSAGALSGIALVGGFIAAGGLALSALNAFGAARGPLLETETRTDSSLEAAH
jgi:heme/copper-type cytochrome/quinol oxidase subunit 1